MGHFDGPFSRARRVLHGGDRLDGRADELKARRFHLFLCGFLCWLIVMMGIVMPWFAARKMMGEGLGFVLAAATVGALVLVRRGRTRSAAYLFLGAFWCVMAVVAMFSGGIHSGGTYMTLFAIVGAAWLIDFPAAVRFGIATLVLTSTEATLALTGHAPPVYFPVTPVAFWTLSVAYVGFTLGALAALLEAERRQLAALRESEDRFHRLSDSAFEGIAIHESGVLLDCNQRFALVFGYASPEELIGKNGLDLLLTQESRARMSERIAHQDTGIVEVTGVRKDGSQFPAEVESRPIRYRGRNARVAAIDDVSERREKRALEAQLRRAQQMESIGRLTGGIAHDFNNLLTVINGYGELLLRRIPAGDPLEQPARAICGAGQRAADLTRRLLLMSGTHAVQARPLDVNALLAENQDLHQRLLGEAIVLEMALRATGYIRADPGQFLQVCLNLVANARDAMPRGGRLTIVTDDVGAGESPVPDVPGAAAGSWVRIVVADTGPGIPPDLQERIFEPFYTTKATDKGVGLGLSIVDGIVRQNGGTVRIDSPPGRGAVFTLFFPRLAPESVPAVAVPGRQPVALSGSETVLVVEDQTEVRQLIVETLAAAGFQVLSAAGAGDALAIAARHAGPIPLLITDVIMPEMNGPAVAEYLATRRPGLRVLFVSGYAEQRPALTASHSASAFLAKPFAPNALVAAVRAILDEPTASVADDAAPCGLP
jgi:PAS domain S-box-containing protein